MYRAISTCLVLASLLGCATTHSAHEPATSSAPDSELAALFVAADEEQLALDPLSALWRGDQRHADRFGSYGSPEHDEAVRAMTRRQLDQLLEIDRTVLDEADQLYFDAFHHQLELTLRGFSTGASETLRQLPLDQLFGFHVTYPDLASGQSVAPFATEENYRDGLARLGGFARYLRRAEAAMRDGITAGHVQPRFVTELVLEQVRKSIELGVEGSPLVAPTQNFPTTIAPEEAEKLAVAYREEMEREVRPALRDLALFLESTYLPASRVGPPGLASMADGEALYRHLVAFHTGSSLTPEEVHQLGLAEVARIRAEMEAVRRRVGFSGTLAQFFSHLRSDPRFKLASAEALLAGYREIQTRVEPQLPELFLSLPRARFEIRAVPPSIEQTAGGAYYYGGTPDGSRPGVFYVNTYDLPSRTRPTMETLFLHEAMPGHHLQVSLIQENDSLPPFMRFGTNTAYIEGWGLYAESLGGELGLFQDPYQYFGHLELEMFRALRLVVDTGLHAKGWSREQAVEYMLGNSSLGESVIRPEVDRYIVWAGQALAYKLGQLAIRNLRTEAEQALGERFDVRHFHDQILGSGALPIPILEAKVRRWIAEAMEMR